MARNTLEAVTDLRPLPDRGRESGRMSQRPPRGTSEEEWEVWARAAAERADPFMAWLGVVFALLIGYELAVDDLSPATERALLVTGWVIWGVFLAEFGLKLWLAPHRWRFIRRHWFQVAALALPTLRLLRFARLLRLGRALPAARVVSSSYRVTGTARRLVRSRLGYLAAVTAVVGVAAGELIYLLERGEPGFESLSDAILWSFSTVVALQADPVPSSVAGRVVMLVAFLYGLVVVAALAGVLGAFFVDERRERAAVEDSSRSH